MPTIFEPEHRQMPSKSNFFSVIDRKSEEELSNAFRKQGWTIHKSSMNHYKFENSWTQLWLDNDKNSLLLHGIAAYHPDNVKTIRQLFDDLGCPYKFEFYDDNNEIIAQTQNGM